MHISIWSIIFDHFPPEEDKEIYYIIPFHFPDDLRRDLINHRYYDELLQFVRKQGSKFAYHILGVEIMECGANMNEKLKQLILDNSKWEDEMHILKNDIDSQERKKYLNEFRESIKNYTIGKKTLVTREYIYDVVERELLKGNRNNIDRRALF